MMLKQFTISLCVLSALSGCAIVGPVDPGETQQLGIETDTRSKDKTRTRNTLLTIGGMVLLGAVIAHEAQDGTEDALRDAARP